MFVIEFSEAVQDQISSPLWLTSAQSPDHHYTLIKVKVITALPLSLSLSLSIYFFALSVQFSISFERYFIGRVVCIATNEHESNNPSVHLSLFQSVD